MKGFSCGKITGVQLATLLKTDTIGRFYLKSPVFILLKFH